MLLHVKRTLRNLWRNRLYTALNLSGLAFGMAAVLLIALWVQNELRSDGYHRRAEHLWRIKTDLQVSPEETWHWGTTPLKITELCSQVPGIQAAAQLFEMRWSSTVLQRGNDLFEETKVGYVGPGWFDLFDYEFVEGSAVGFGDRPNDLLLTDSLARKIFGDHSALGATLRIDSTEFVVHAVLRDPRPESSFRDRVLLPLEAHLRVGNRRQEDATWNNFNYNTFIELHPNADPSAVATQLTGLLCAAKQDSNLNLQLGRLTDLHFDDSLQSDTFDKGSRRSVGAFALLGLVILLMAAINYVSLTTARAHTRAREAGVRKIVGAGRGQLFSQFLAESALLTVGASLLALVLAHLALPWLSDVAERPFDLRWQEPLPWLLLGGTLAGTVLLAGVYPALLLSGFRPLQVLRGNGKVGHRSGLRRGLVVAQFALSVTLLICTVVIGRQRAFIQQKEMGYDREQVFAFSLGFRHFRNLGPEKGNNLLEAFEQTLRNAPGVLGVSRANGSPVHIESTHSGSVKFDGLPEDAEPTVSMLCADEHFDDLFGLKMQAGRWLETGDANNVVLNETAARQLGLPEPWVGQRFEVHGRTGQVVGVVRDFHFLPLHEAITPLVVYQDSNNWLGNFFVKTQPGQSAQALASAQAMWAQWLPGRPFRYTFLDDDFNKMYRAEQRAGLLFNVFAGLAIFIACLGLFGLATLVAEQRTKEVGIRKVLGASVLSVTRLLTRDFLWLVLVAVAIATPLAGWLMQRWLADYAYRIELQWWMFAGAGAVAVTIALLTVGFQSVKAALANPVRSLRNE